MLGLGLGMWDMAVKGAIPLEEQIAYDHLPPNDNSFNAGHVFVFDAAQLDIPDFTVSGVKLELAGSVNSIYIGPQAASGDAYDAASLTQIFFGGSPSISQAFDAVTVSDLAEFTWDKTANLLISAFKDTGRMPTDASAVVTWWSSADGSEVGVANKTLVYSNGGGVVGGVSKIILFGN